MSLQFAEIAYIWYQIARRRRKISLLLAFYKVEFFILPIACPNIKGVSINQNLLRGAQHLLRGPYPLSGYVSEIYIMRLIPSMIDS